MMLIKIDLRYMVSADTQNNAFVNRSCTRGHAALKRAANVL